MHATQLAETTDRGWCIRIGEVFDLEVAAECLRHCRDDKTFPPEKLLFDLTRTRLLSTAGIGAMLHIKHEYQVNDERAVIVYQDPAVGELLRLSRLHQSFQLLARGWEDCHAIK